MLNSIVREIKIRQIFNKVFDGFISMQTRVYLWTTIIQFIPKLFRHHTLFNKEASLNIGAICEIRQPPNPQPMRVTKKCCSGCPIAYFANLSTAAFTSVNPTPAVAIAYDLP